MRNIQGQLDSAQYKNFELEGEITIEKFSYENAQEMISHIQLKLYVNK